MATSSDESLSEHAIILRSILTDVEKLVGNLPPPRSATLSSHCEGSHNNSLCDARGIAESIKDRRRKGLADFLTKESTVDVVRIINGDDSAELVVGDETEIMLTPLEFKQRYVYRNIPAIVRGLEDEGCSFCNLARIWRKHSRDGKTSIRCSWFSENVGGKFLLVMDDGRAAEFSSPKALMQDPTSLFSDIVRHAKAEGKN